MLEKLAQTLYSSGQKVVDIMKMKLDTKVTAGNTRPHSTTFGTSNSISANFPNIEGDILTWNFVAEDSAVRLNTGGSLKQNAEPGNQDVPYGRFDKSKPKSDYIAALALWATSKYGVDGYTAKRMAFAIAQAAEDRGQTVKAAGWLDDAKRELEEEVRKSMDFALSQEINNMVRTNLKL